MTNPRRNEEHNQDEWFWPKVDKSGDCWMWLASGVGGYGTVQFNGKKQRAHRVSYLLHFDDPPPDKPCVLHSCDNPGCVRPSHLFPGTMADNSSDMVRKGRQRGNPDPSGEKNGRAKLSREDVERIRNEHEEGRGSYRSLATDFGVTPSCIRDIIKRRTWREK